MMTHEIKQLNFGALKPDFTSVVIFHFLYMTHLKHLN